MLTHRPLLLLSFLLIQNFRPSFPGPNGNTIPFNGSAAFKNCERAVAFGERPSGSPANVKLRNWILAQLKPLGGELKLDSFTASTPSGPILMANVILKFPGSSGHGLAVTGHFDTKKIPMVQFLGANDGGSSTGFLLEFARVMARTPHKDDVYIVFFDGEEAVATWNDYDSTYGSRHLADTWGREGVLAHLRALINVDMIGDKDLQILNDSNSNPALRQDLLNIAAKLGYAKFFQQQAQGIEDDHIPFAQSGVDVLDVIDFSYGPNNAYWHTGEDRMDKLSTHSFRVVGEVVLALIRSLDG